MICCCHYDDFVCLFDLILYVDIVMIYCGHSDDLVCHSNDLLRTF